MGEDDATGRISLGKFGKRKTRKTADWGTGGLKGRRFSQLIEGGEKQRERSYKEEAVATHRGT